MKCPECGTKFDISDYKRYVIDKIYIKLKDFVKTIWEEKDSETMAAPIILPEILNALTKKDQPTASTTTH